MSRSIPRAREDLEVHERRDPDGGQSFIVTDRLLGSYHRIGPEAFATLEALEAADLAPEELDRALAARGLGLPPEHLGAIVQQLATAGLLEVTGAEARARGEPDGLCAELDRRRAADRPGFATLQTALLGRWRGRPPPGARMRRRRVPLFDPTPLLARAAPLGRLLLTWPAAVTVGLLALVATGMVLGDRARLGHELATTFSAPLTIAVLVTVGLLHELGHGTALFVYGGTVREVGVMLLYSVLPAAYCDVSDAHLLQSRGRRAVVALAGCYVNLLLWCAAVLVWRLCEPALLVTRVALSVIAVTGLSLTFNLNPLLPLDGYYALQELLGVENLRARGARRGGVYRAYRLLSTGYLCVFLPLTLHAITSVLIRSFHFVGLVASAAIILLMAGPLAQRAARWLVGRA